MHLVGIGTLAADGQIICRDVTFDAEFISDMFGDLASAPALDAGQVEIGKSAAGHAVMIAAQNLTG